MNFKKGDIVELAISDLAFGGAGVGKIPSESGEFVVFVERTVPGDKISARLTRIKKNYAEAEIEKIITPSPSRITPRCKHFGVCGGCSLQNINYEEQLKWKEKMVSDALSKIGGFKDLQIPAIKGCEKPWFYRNKMEYTFGEKNGGGLVLGLHPAKNYRDVFDLEECFLESELSVKIAQEVEKWGMEMKIPPYTTRLNQGVLRNLIVREGKNTGEIMVNLVTNGMDFPHEKEFRDIITQKFPEVTSLYRTAVTVRRGHRTITQEFHLAGKKTLSETLELNSGSGEKLSLKFEILPQAFFQPNTLQAQILYGKILEFARPEAKDAVLDLFCGTGTIGMFFAKLAGRVTGVDSNESAITNAIANAGTNKISNMEFLCSDVFKFLEKNAKSHSVLITDPPRAGIAEKALEKIFPLKIPKWLYVSCNPTTLARDLKIICANGYKIKGVQPIDMFPHTYHVETICLLSA